MSMALRSRTFLRTSREVSLPLPADTMFQRRFFNFMSTSQVLNSALYTLMKIPTARLPEFILIPFQVRAQYELQLLHICIEKPLRIGSRQSARIPQQVLQLKTGCIFPAGEDIGNINGERVIISDSLLRVRTQGRQYIIASVRADIGLSELRTLISEEEPDLVCLKIHRERLQALEDPHVWTNLDLSEVLRERKGFFLLGYVYLTYYRKALGISSGEPGSEMYTAYRAAAELNVPVKFCDRGLGLTFQRAWEQAGLTDRMKMSLIPAGMVLFRKERESFNSHDQGIQQTMFKKLASRLPSVRNILLEERTEYMAETVVNTQGKRILVLVEPGEVREIAEAILKADEIRRQNRLSELEDTSGKKGLIRYVPYTLALAVAAAATAGVLFSGGKSRTAELLWLWISANSVLSSAGALTAGGHYLTILTSLVMAPVTSLFPFVGAGMFAGFVQYRIKKPRVMDFQNLRTDLGSPRGIRLNRLTRIIAVYLLANLGSIAGSSIYLLFLTSFYVD
ncbi:MAG: TraB family protein [Candidatus Aegiribacteria sp.]|nr:TraB family protein [Candidatus Aegiribacteria sp.]MBD3294737.1 TraB family protein [Candidatus Fermentibacteria bacterium]